MVAKPAHLLCEDFRQRIDLEVRVRLAE